MHSWYIRNIPGLWDLNYGVGNTHNVLAQMPHNIAQNITTKYILPSEQIPDRLLAPHNDTSIPDAI